jgi:hypothetical protein
MSLSLESTITFNTTVIEEYTIGGNASSDELKIGIGTYIFKSVNREYPIAFNVANTPNIEFLGLSHNLYTTDIIKTKKAVDTFTLGGTDTDDKTEGVYTGVECTGGTGAGLTIDFEVDSSGAITENTVVINNPGSGYTKNDELTIQTTGGTKDSTLTINSIKENLSRQHNKPFTVVYENNIYYFYHGNVALRVTGDFGSIPGYLYLKNGKFDSSSQVITHKINYDNSNTNGSSVTNYLELYELNNNRIPYNFFHTGNNENGTLVESRDKISSVNVSYYPFIHAYSDMNKSTCMYITSNNIPNYKPYHTETLIYETSNPITNSTNLWSISAFNNMDVFNYGIDRQIYGYVNNSRQVVGYPYKIPVNPTIAGDKIIINDLYETAYTPIYNEAFWYKNDTNWKELMTDRNYDSVNLGTGFPNSLTPLGPIGVAVNGIPFYNHFNLTDTISQATTDTLTDLTDPIVQRNITLDTNPIITRTDKVIERNYDNYGGTIDKNFNYYYNKYPVSLEAMLKIGTLTNSTTNFLYDKVFTNAQTTIYISGSLSNTFYFNISEENFEGFKFRVVAGDATSVNIDQLKIINNNLEVVGLPGETFGAHLCFKYLSTMFTETTNFKAKLQAIKGNNTISIGMEFHSTNTSSKVYVYLKKDTTTIERFDSPSLGGFTYTGVLKNIDSTISTTNEIKLFLEYMKTEGNTSADKYDYGHSPILGWAFDGYPIYGLIGYTNDNNKILKFLKSSYVDGKYQQNSGDLDLCNGIYSKTPEFPNGIYHYVCTIDITTDNGIGIITLSNVNSTTKNIYTYPYVIGAYKGIPELSNFTLVTSTSGSYTTTSYSSGSTTSSLVVSDTTNYDVNFRSIKSHDDKFNGSESDSISISQDDNFITLQKGSKPYIWNFTGSNSVVDDYFGVDNSNFGSTFATLANTVSTELYRKAYGSVSKFKYASTDDVTLGKAVMFSGDFVVKDCDVSGTKPIIGVAVRVDTINKFCYVVTEGLCEVTTINGSPTINNLLSSHTDGTVMKYTVSDIGETVVNYILGIYVGQNGSGNHLININTHTLLG